MSMASTLLIVFLMIFIVHPAVHANPEVEALKAFKEKLDDPDNVLDNWDDTLVDPCTWHHITCDSNNHVTHVDVFGNGRLSGPLAPELGNLAYVQKLTLNSNRINGPIPKELGRLTNLVGLYLNNNALTGPIPDELGDLNTKTMKFLWLNDNHLTGGVPQKLVNIIPKLQVVGSDEQSLEREVHSEAMPFWR
ncbi:hypothetical protein OROMI_010738 [Orobanche minor]